MYLAVYRTKMHTTKWYCRITFHLFSLAAVNSFLIYHQLGGTNSLLDSLTDICRSLLFGENNDSESENIISAKKVQSLKASKVPASVHFDNIGHWPVKSLPQTGARWMVVAAGQNFSVLSAKCICVWQKVVKHVFWTFMELTHDYILYFSKQETIYL